MIIDSVLRFEKLTQIGNGQGLNSTVWLARDHQLDCTLVVKEIDKTTFWNPNCFAEAQAVYAVNHPNIVAVQYGCEEGNSAFIGMPYYSAGSLATLLSSGPLELSRLLVLTQDMLLGIGHIHTKGFIHLDLKPTNIFLSDRGRALVADFGQARQIGVGGTVSAPPMYCITMPPEVLVSGNASYVSDLYQIGALVYRAANGEQHWNEQLARYSSDVELQAAIRNGKFPDRNKFLPHIPKRLRTAIRKALDTDPARRFATSSSFGAELGRIQLKYHWNVVIDASGEATWTATTPTGIQLSVELRSSSPSWKVEVFTVSGGSKRARKKSETWGSFNNRELAFKHLKNVFELL